MGVRVRELKSGEGDVAGIIPPRYPSRVWAPFPVEQALGDTINISGKEVSGFLDLKAGCGGWMVKSPEGGDPVLLQSIVNNEAVWYRVISEMQKG